MADLTPPAPVEPVPEKKVPVLTDEQLAAFKALPPICALTLSLVLTAAPAWAEWVKVGTTNMAVHYFDPATVSKDGNFRRVWALQDLVETSEAGVRSIRALQEYDCEQQRFRYLAVAAHSGPMGGGWIVASHEMRDRWTVRTSAIGKMVCGI